MSYQKRLDSESFRILNYLTPSHPGPAIYLPPVTPLAFGKVAWWALKSWHSCSIPIISPWFHHVTIWNVIAPRWKKGLLLLHLFASVSLHGKVLPQLGMVFHLYWGSNTVPPLVVVNFGPMGPPPGPDQHEMIRRYQNSGCFRPGLCQPMEQEMGTSGPKNRQMEESQQSTHVKDPTPPAVTLRLWRSARKSLPHLHRLHSLLHSSDLLQGPMPGYTYI